MQKLISLNNFAKAGINSDLMPWDLPGDFLTELKNIRIYNGKLTPLGGYSTLVDLPVDFIPGYIINVNTANDSIWVIPGQSSVLAYDGNSFGDISSVVGYGSIVSEHLWQGDLLATVLVLNNPEHYPEYLPTPNIGSQLVPLPWDATTTWSDAVESARIIRSHKQFLFALDLVSQGASIPDGVRWSAPADVNSVPPTWDPLDVTSTAGFVTLGGSGGNIVDGRSLRDAFVVYRESGVTIFDYVGGQFVWQIRHVSSNVGLVSPDSILEVKSKHYFIGDGDILVNDGNTITSLLHNRLRRRFVANYDPDNFRNSYAVLNSVLSEAWFCVPAIGKTFPTIAYIYNWRDDTWSIRDIPESPHANYGIQGSETATWDTAIGAWDGAQNAWGQSAITPLDDTIVCVTQPVEIGSSGKILLLDVIASDNELEFPSIIERTDFALEGLSKVTTITRIYPHMRGPGSVYIQLGSQDRPGAPIRWKPEVLFNASDDRKVDIRTTGELHCFRFRQDNLNSNWELSGIDVEYVNAGLR